MDDFMKIAIIFVGTAKYKKFFEGYYEGIMKNFLPRVEKTIFAFTDEPSNPAFDKPNVVIKKIEHLKWPFITLFRFKFIKSVKEELLTFDNIFFIDADLWAINPINEEEFPLDKPLLGVQHPGFIGKIGTFETDTRSKANIFDNKYDLSKYRQGCLWGGKTNSVIEMVEELDDWIEEDLRNQIVAVWHDESHMNKYFLVNSNKIHTVHPGFAQPQIGYENIRNFYPTKFIHLHKEMEEFPRFSGVR